MALNLAMGFVIIVSFLFYLARSQFLLRLVSVPIFYIMLVWLGMQLYLFPLLIEQKNKQIKLIFKHALVLAVGNVMFTAVLGLLLLSVLLITTTLTGPILIILISFLTVAQTLALQELLGVRYQETEK